MTFLCSQKLNTREGSETQRWREEGKENEEGEGLGEGEGKKIRGKQGRNKNSP